MKSNLRKTWIAVGIIWAGVLLLTCWNTSVSSQIRETKKRKETFMKDNQFWMRNADIIARVLRADDAAYHQPASLQIGLLQIRDHLRELAAHHHLKNVRMERNQINTSDQGEVPVDIFLAGSLEHAMLWLNTMEKEYKYLSVIRFAVTSDGRPEQSQFHFSINYRYRILGSGPT